MYAHSKNKQLKQKSSNGTTDTGAHHKKNEITAVEITSGDNVVAHLTWMLPKYQGRQK